VPTTAAHLTDQFPYCTIGVQIKYSVSGGTVTNTHEELVTPDLTDLGPLATSDHKALQWSMQIRTMSTSMTRQSTYPGNPDILELAPDLLGKFGLRHKLVSLQMTSDIHQDTTTFSVNRSIFTKHIITRQHKLGVKYAIICPSFCYMRIYS